MKRLHQQRIVCTAKIRMVLLVVAALSVGVVSASAAITLTADPDYPAFPDIFTTNPAAFGTSSHGFTEARMLRQTFNNPSAFDIGQIVLSLDLNGTDGTVGGLIVSLYNVDNVNAATWEEGNPQQIKTWTVPTTEAIPATDFRLGLNFTGADVFNLAQRDEGTAGYGIEVSNVDMTTNMGGLAVTPADEIDRYAAGVFYREDGTISRVYRDAGVSLLSDSALPPVDGDVNNDRLVNLDDFQIITDNFRDSVGSRSFGDLTADGIVDFADFRDWKNNYDPPPGSAAVPEPATALLAFVGLAFACGQRRRRGSTAPRSQAGKRWPVARSLHPGVCTSSRWARGLCSAGILLLLTTASGRAAVTLTADPEYPDPADLGAFTLDPEGLDTAQRGIAGTRLLRQTFQVDETFFVGGAVLAADMSGADGGLLLSFYEVADVNAETWEPLGSPLKRITIPVGVDIPDTTVRLGLEFTGSDSFTMPARNAGMEGYGIEISNADEMTTVGLIRHSNRSGIDDYEFGKFYTESGGQSGSGIRDWGVALVTTDIAPPGPGDVDENMVVNLDDLTIIRTNFSDSVTARIEGDLTGDGLVSFDDFRQWKDNYPPANPDPGGSARVPEPGALALALLAATCVLGRRRRRRLSRTIPLTL